MKKQAPSFSSIPLFAPLNSEPEPALQTVEVATFFQIPNFQIIGLPAPEVSEARERIRAAVERSGFTFPRRRVVVNLSPASIRKRGTGLDLAMALAVLSSSERSENNESARIVAWGELGLDGSIKPSGQLTRTLFAAWEFGATDVLIGIDEAAAALEKLRWIEEYFQTPPPRLVPVADLKEAWRLFSSPELRRSKSIPLLPRAAEKTRTSHSPASATSFGLLPLAAGLERVIGMSAAGAHHLLLLGPKGSGKSHASDWLLAVQPEVTAEVRIRAALLEELNSNFSSSKLYRCPVRRISTQARPSALIGGAQSNWVRPGEYSLSHGGVLVADEFPEWSRDSRESLREPLERGRVTLTRAQGSLELPARFTFVANGNLCPCGGWPSTLPAPVGENEMGSSNLCQCPPRVRKAYLARLSGPVLDRIDALYLVSSAPRPASTHNSPAKKLMELQQRVTTIREGFIKRFGSAAGFLSAEDIENLLNENPEWEKHLQTIGVNNLRSRHKVVRLALSLAAWDDAASPQRAHFLEAAYYRPERVLHSI